MKGIKVVVVTHNYGNRKGIRWFKNGLKVYYIPRLCVFRHSTFPTLIGPIELLRDIFIREQVNLFHGHTSYSTLVHEAIFTANRMKIPCCITEHSLTGSGEIGADIINFICRWTVVGVDQVICVSKACQNNYAIRTKMDPNTIQVITNAVDVEQFSPRTEEEEAKREEEKRRQHRENHIVVTILSRLTYRKGTDLMISVIPQICKKYDYVDFYIGGDGDRRIDVEQMIETEQLKDRVITFGNIHHSKARDFLIKGDIFLNCSLTEAFGIAILEAACSGLFIVATNVDGVPEVLPSHMIKLCDPNTISVFCGLSWAIENFHSFNARMFHDELVPLYSWEAIATRTISVYKQSVNVTRKKPNDFIKRFFQMGAFPGILFSLHLIFFSMIFLIICGLSPAKLIEPAINYPSPVDGEKEIAHTSKSNWRLEKESQDSCIGVP
eukprot:MONOS_6537.1-p1 / transcript=MONOS_6537.1 / gene=MONOS_6537 / organism=Monocercomonoides_exilis_PA203 / gene_product=GlcNAc transferase / transcript_product=GlcNAc transferase / location=Mono_scaffold00207:46447-48888(+) / protein_length=437 / sequence_SO=supercontig / SO=protein_coding / is_pseudo=false